MKKLAVITLLLSGCMTTQEINLADGSKGHQISCNGTVRTMGDCLVKAGEICGSQGYDIVDERGSTAPFSMSTGTVNANQNNVYGGYQSQSGMMVARSVLIKCKQ